MFWITMKKKRLNDEWMLNEWWVNTECFVNNEIKRFVNGEGTLNTWWMNSEQTGKWESRMFQSLCKCSLGIGKDHINGPMFGIEISKKDVLKIFLRVTWLLICEINIHPSLWNAHSFMFNEGAWSYRLTCRNL